MAKFISRLFRNSFSSKNSSFQSSQPSITDSQNRSSASNVFRSASSLETLSSYRVTSKELEKSKLHKASWEGNINKVQRFASPGQINVKDSQQRTPLHLAIVKGHIDIIQYLVQEGAKLDVTDQDRRTPLVKAVLSGNQNRQVNFKICQFLLESGADASINAADCNGKNALHYAIDFDNVDLVELFLSSDNCDPNYTDRDQMTPLHLAIKRNNPQIVELLVSNQSQTADPNIANRDGQTPLHLAARVGYIEIIRLLLSPNRTQSCDTEITDSQQLTAHELAKANHHEECAKLIEEYHEKWLKQTPRRTISINEQSSMKITSLSSINPAANLQHDNDETSDDSSSTTNHQPFSKLSARKNQRPSDQWSVDNNLENVSTLLKTNPLFVRADSSETESSKQDSIKITTKNKSIPFNKQNQSESYFGIGPVAERKGSDNTSTSVSIEKSKKPIETKSNILKGLKSIPSTKSWSDDTITSPSVEKVVPIKKQESQSDTWDTSRSDNDTNVIKSKYISPKLQKSKTILPTERKNSFDSDSESSSFKTEILSSNFSKLPKTSTGTIYEVFKPKDIHSPVSEDSSWTTSSPVKKTSTKEISNIVKQEKNDESTWDDSRPLSSKSKSSNVIRPTDLSKSSMKGIDALLKITESIIPQEKKSISSKISEKDPISTINDDDDDKDSILSENTLHEVENNEENSIGKTETLIKSQHPSIFIGKSHIQDSKLPLNNTQLNEINENIKRIERNQEDTHELKQQLKEMENKKNNFEKLYQDKLRLLDDTERRLEREKFDKDNLERKTKDLDIQLKNTKQTIQKIKDEKDVLQQRCEQLEKEQDNQNEQFQSLKSNSNDINQIRTEHREKMKSISIENDNLHSRAKKLQSDLDLYKDSIDYTKHYETDFEKFLEERTFLQHELERLKFDKDRITKEKLEYQLKYDGLQEEIRKILLDRSNLEQRLTGELHEHFQEKQRTIEDQQKYQIEIEQLNIKLDDAESRLRLLQTQNQTLTATKNRDFKHEYDLLTERYNEMEMNDQFETTEPSIRVRSAPQTTQHLTSTSLRKSNTFEKQNSFVHENELNQSYPPLNYETYLKQNSKQIQSDTERIKSELEYLRHNFNKLISTYEPTNTYQRTIPIDTLRSSYNQEYREREFLMSQLTTQNVDSNRTSFNDNRLLKEQLQLAIGENSQTMNSIPEIPRLASSLLTSNQFNNDFISSSEFVRNRYRV